MLTTTRVAMALSNLGLEQLAGVDRPSRRSEAGVPIRVDRPRRPWRWPTAAAWCARRRTVGRHPGSAGSVRPHAWGETAADLAAGRPVHDLDDVDVHTLMLPRTGNRII